MLAHCWLRILKHSFVRAWHSISILNMSIYFVQYFGRPNEAYNTDNFFSIFILFLPFSFKLHSSPNNFVCFSRWNGLELPFWYPSCILPKYPNSLRFQLQVIGRSREKIYAPCCSSFIFRPSIPFFSFSSNASNSDKVDFTFSVSPLTTSLFTLTREIQST